MTIYINSNDYTSGTSSNGVWDINKTLLGSYTLLSQNVESQDIPWFWTGLDSLVIKTWDPDIPATTNTFTVVFSSSTGLLDTVSTISTQLNTSLQDKFDDIALINPKFQRSVSHSINTSNQTVTFTFDQPVDILWSNVSSTIREAFGKSATNQINTSSMVISSKYMTIDPKYLEVYITESETQYNTSHSTSPTILFSTKDSEFTGQLFEIRKSQQQLTIKIYRENVESQVVPLSDEWTLVFSPK